MMKPKESRISHIASCIRHASATTSLKRSQLPDASKYNPSEYYPVMSGKFYALIEKIKHLDAQDMKQYGTKFKHFIFTDVRNATNGVKALAGYMIANGFELRMTHEPSYVKRNGKLVETLKGQTVFVVKDPVLHGCDGFAILQSQPLWKNPMTVTTKKAILQTFNKRPENIHGELLRIVILDSKYKEGIDLFDVKYVHLCEPAIANSDLKQAIGRATRFCGQKGLHFAPNRGWALHVYTYHTELPNRPPFTLGEDQKVDAHELMLAHSGLDLALLNLTKELTILAIRSAVDYDLNYKINNFLLDESMYEVTDYVLEVSQSGGANLHSIENLDPILLEKCMKRQSKLFPFSKQRMMRVAQRLGLHPPKNAKREWYCRVLETNPTYFDALMKSPETILTTPMASFVPTTTKPTWFSTVPSTPGLYGFFPTSSSRTIDQRIVPALFPTPDSRSRKTSKILTDRLPFHEFQDTIRALYKKYTWASPIVKSGCDAVVALGSGRPVTFTQTQDFIRHYLTPESPFKGLLAWHSVGTGKTCMAVSTASDAFESAGYTILWVTRNALMSDVYKNIFGSVCSIPIIEKIEGGLVLPPALKDKKKLLSRQWIPPISYRMFQNALERKNELGRRLYEASPTDPLRKTFLIIDEIHKLKDGDLAPSEYADFSKIQDYIHTSYKVSGSDSVRPLLMTATPITDNPNDLFEILNILIPLESKRFPDFNVFREKYSTSSGEIHDKGKEYFMERAKGLISYLNREFDPTTFAQPKFHKVIVPVGEPIVPSVEDLVDICLADKTVALPSITENCDAIDGQQKEELDALEAEASNEKDKKKRRLQINKTYKKLKSECMKRLRNTRKLHASIIKNAIKESNKCYMDYKKQYTQLKKVSQIQALEKCFRRETFKRPFVEKKAYTDEIRRRITQKNPRSIRSTGAVIVSANE